MLLRGISQGYRSRRVQACADVEHPNTIDAAQTDLMDRNLQFNFLSAIAAMIILSQPNSANTLSAVRTAPERNIYDSINNNGNNCRITEGWKLCQKRK